VTLFLGFAPDLVIFIANRDAFFALEIIPWRATDFHTGLALQGPAIITCDLFTQPSVLIHVVPGRALQINTTVTVFLSTCRADQRLDTTVSLCIKHLWFHTLIWAFNLRASTNHFQNFLALG
jgi:hypothetical protein